MNDTELRAQVESIVDPELGRSLGELRMVRSVESVDGAPRVTIELPTTAYPHPERFEELVSEVAGPDVQLTLERTVRGSNSGGTIGLKIANVICVGSGKGTDTKSDKTNLTVPFGGEVYLLLLLAAYGIYALSRRRQ